MEVEFLGSGGAITIPVPGCQCAICVEARAKGIPYARSGPATFVHGPDVLIDTPEEIKEQLNRSQVTHIAAATYSHWHPDHTMGRRVWEMNYDWRHWPPTPQTTPIYLPQQVAEDFEHYHGIWQHLTYLENSGLVALQRVPDGKCFSVGTTRITPVALADPSVYAFIFEDEGRRLFVAQDELVGWHPPGDLGHLDLAVLPLGMMEFHPLSGRRLTPAGHPVLEDEATFRQTLEIVRELHVDRVVMMHIEEPDQVSYDDLELTARQLANDGYNITFAYDGLICPV